MPTFWRDIVRVCFRHAGEDYLATYDQEIILLLERVRDLEDAMTSAQGDVAALEALYTSLDEATNDIASKLNSLIDHANTGNVSAADVVSHLTPLVARLQDMGKDSTVEGPTDPTTNTDPTNSPTADSPVVVPAPDAPTDEPTNDPTVNPVDINPASLPADQGNQGDSAFPNSSNTVTNENSGNTGTSGFASDSNTSSTDW